MTDTAVERLTTGPAIAAAIATEIRRKGHYQGKGDKIGGTACLIANDAYQHVTSIGWNEYINAVAMEIGANAFEYGFALWNDSHTTAEVLAVLDKIAGQEPDGHNR